MADAATVKPPAMRNIYRKGENGGTAWQVGIARNSPRRTYNKVFNDVRYGGEEKALAAAQAWRDEMERLHPPKTKQSTSLQPRRNNTSGKPGVWRSVDRQRRADGREVRFINWVATTPSWVKPRRLRCFSVAKYGEQEAYQRAVAAREAFEAEAALTEAGRRPVFAAATARLANTGRRNLLRIENAVGASWRASVNRSAEGKRFTRSFPDAQYGGEAGALAAAQAWRDETERRHPQLTRKDRLARLRKSNTSGKTGVQRQLTLYRHLDGGEHVVAYWKAFTPTSVKPRRYRSFSVEKYGEQEAYRLAVEARLAFEALLDDDA
jgi:hypothetical protein